MSSTPSKRAFFALSAAARYCSMISAISTVSSARCGDGCDVTRDVCRAASMPQLGEHVAALGMDRTRDALPARHLLIAVDSRRASIAASRRCNRRRLGENQPAIGGTLAIVFAHQIARNTTRPLSAEPTQRRHNNAMFERDRPDLHRRE